MKASEFVTWLTAGQGFKRNMEPEDHTDHRHYEKLIKLTEYRFRFHGSDYSTVFFEEKVMFTWEILKASEMENLSFDSGGKMTGFEVI